MFFLCMDTHLYSYYSRQHGQHGWALHVSMAMLKDKGPCVANACLF